MRNLVIVAATAALAMPALAQNCSTFANTPPGTNLQLGDDGVRTLRLPFAFPWNGGTVNSITVCSNGFVWLGAPPATGANDLSDSEAEMLSQPSRVAVCWDDWNPASTALQAGGGVFFVANAVQASVVWKGVPRFGSTTVFAQMEVVLSITGEIDLVYDSSMGIPTSTCIAGISAGNGATANPVDWTPTLPANVPNATGYQLFTTNTGAAPFDLAGQSIGLTPGNPSLTDYLPAFVTLGTCAPGNYPALASTSTFGSGCPNTNTASSIYETFTSDTGASPIDLASTGILFSRSGTVYVATGTSGAIDTSYTSADIVTLGDDTVQAGLSLGAMGTFPFGSMNVATVSACSNGFLWLDNGTGTDFSPSATEFNNQGPRIAPFWTDLNLSSTGGGTFYWTTTAAYCLATWENVAEYNQPSSQRTFQVKLYANGDIGFNYGNLGSVTHDILVGVSRGNVLVDPGASDLSTVSTSPITRDLGVLQTPLIHTLSGLPVLGGSYTLECSNIPQPGSLIGVFFLGFTQFNPGLDLSVIGMPGCQQYTSLDVSLVNLLNGMTTMSNTVPVPNNAALIGLTVYSQAATLSPGINAFGAITSNGASATVGI